jgi:hypothetical protein
VDDGAGHLVRTNRKLYVDASVFDELIVEHSWTVIKSDPFMALSAVYELP